MRLRHLNLNVEIEPESSHLRVKGDIILDGVQDRLELLLNPCLEVTSLSIGRGKDTIALSLKEKRPPEGLFILAACYEASIPEDLRNIDELEFSIEYEGKLYRYSFDTTHIRADYVELAIYALWYPLTSFEDHPTFDVQVKGPEDWIWVMNGRRTGKSSWRRDSPATDLTLHGRPKKNAIDSEKNPLFWGDPRNLERLKPLEAEFTKLKDDLIEWLGQPDETSLRIVLVPRDFGGGYSRTGLIVVQDDMMESIKGKTESAVQYWGHEFAHSWFNKTSVNEYHNWVDEAFATYASFLGVESVYGKSVFESFIEKYKERLAREKDLPPLCETDRKHEKSQVLYYVYGTLLLHEIQQKIGRDTFLEFMAYFAQMCVERSKITTEDLIEALGEVTGEDWEPHIESRISMPPEHVKSFLPS